MTKVYAAILLLKTESSMSVVMDICHYSTPFLESTKNYGMLSVLSVIFFTESIKSLKYWKTALVLTRTETPLAILTLSHTKTRIRVHLDTMRLRLVKNT